MGEVVKHQWVSLKMLLKNVSIIAWLIIAEQMRSKSFYHTLY